MDQFQSYDDCIQWLFKQFPSYQKIGSKAYKPTLENTRLLLDHFNNPEENLKFIHVAGSNGKGSVSAFIASLAVESGYRTGLFTSPHIKDFRERIRVNGEMISEEDILEDVERIRSFNLTFSPSFFEITLVLALNHFARKKCDLVVLETGLGGRLDATNVVTPELSIITSISLEHQHILGDTIEAIAAEKAGIVKLNKPVVLGKMRYQAQQVIAKKARQCHSNVFTFEKSQFPLPSELQIDYQKVNFRTADTAIDVLNEKGWNFKREYWNSAIRNLRMNTGFFGRFELINSEPLEIWDVSHNAEGIHETLLSFQNMISGRLNIVIGLSSDKNITEIVQVIPSTANLFVTTFQSERSASIEQLKAEFDERRFRSISYYTDPQTALETAKKNIKKDDGVIVLGSFFLFENLS